MPRRNLTCARIAALLGVLSIGASDARAQFPDLVELGAQYLPGIELADLAPAHVQVASYDANLNVPIVLGKSTFLIPGLAYHVDSVSYADAPKTLENFRAFHSLDVTLLFVQLLPKNFSLSLRVAAGLAGDFQAVDPGMLRMSFLAMATYSFSDALVVGLGGIGSYSFGTFLPLPALYLDWKPHPRFELEAFIPAFVDAKVKFARRVELGLRVEVAGNAYAIRDADVSDTWPCAPAEEGVVVSEGKGEPIPSRCFDNVAYSVVVVGPRVGVRLFSDVWLTFFGGRSVYRRLEQMNADGENINGGPEELPNAFFFRAALTWRLPRG